MKDCAKTPVLSGFEIAERDQRSSKKSQLKFSVVFNIGDQKGSQTFYNSQLLTIFLINVCFQNGG